jgi:hypothetical protein
MTLQAAAEEIVRIAVKVEMVQIHAVCDGIAHWRVYSQIPHQRALERLSQSEFKFMTQFRSIVVILLLLSAVVKCQGAEGKEDTVRVEVR